MDRQRAKLRSANAAAEFRAASCGDEVGRVGKRELNARCLSSTLQTRTQLKRLARSERAPQALCFARTHCLVSIFVFFSVFSFLFPLRSLAGNTRRSIRYPFFSCTFVPTPHEPCGTNAELVTHSSLFNHTRSWVLVVLVVPVGRTAIGCRGVLCVS